MTQIKIAITPRHLKNRDGDFLCVEKKYLDFWDKYGYELVVIPFNKNIDFNEYIKEHKIKALLIAGGYRYYSNEIREFENKVITTFLGQNLPIIGVCCGMWSINGYFGGNLRWNEKHSKRNFRFLSKYLIKKMMGRHHFPQHKVIVDNSIIKGGTANVNSFHRKVIDKLGKGLTPFVFSPDGEIEGVYNKEKKIVALQFHLEYNNCSKWLEQNYMSYIKKMI